MYCATKHRLAGKCGAQCLGVLRHKQIDAVFSLGVAETDISFAKGCLYCDAIFRY